MLALKEKTMIPSKSRLKKLDFSPGSCLVKVDGKRQPACQATLKYEKGEPYRLITSIRLSRPENYLSLYQCGCNFSCRKCHSWYFSEVQEGSWYKPAHILIKSREYEKGVDAFWLDIKAYNAEKHTWLTGCSNERILRLPEEILKRGLTLEVLSPFIPDLVESDELERIARVLTAVDAEIPFTILAFFPEYQMKDFRSPNTKEMVDAYRKVKSAGLKNIQLGNLGVFVCNDVDWDYLKSNIEMNALS